MSAKGYQIAGHDEIFVLRGSPVYKDCSGEFMGLIALSAGKLMEGICLHLSNK